MAVPPVRTGSENPPAQPLLVNQGEWLVSDDPKAVLSTVLGSCIAACVRDRVAGVGGMNHFLLAEPPGSAASLHSATARYGAYAMETLINAVLARGSGNKRNLEFKLFGGGRITAGLQDVGAKNIAFVRAFLAEEGYAIAGEDLGGTVARRVLYTPSSGKAMVKRVADGGTHSVVAAEIALAGRRPSPTAEIELF
jgi:chemotaxis protein CheD